MEQHRKHETAPDSTQPTAEAAEATGNAHSVADDADNGRDGSRSSSGCSSPSSACVELDSASDEEREEIALGDDAIQSGPPLTHTHREAARIKLRAFAAELLHTPDGQSHRALPSHLARALTVLAHREHESLLRVMHHYSVLDGSCADGQIWSPPAPPSAPRATTPRPTRTRCATEHDRLVLREEMIYQTWRIVAKIALEPDFDLIYSSCSLLDAKDSAAADRALSRVDGVSFVYGEVTFLSLATILARHWRHNLAPGVGSFIDIGSGSGRAVFTAGAVHEFASCTGVEILRGLVGESTRVLREYEADKAAVVEENVRRRNREYDEVIAQQRAATAMAAGASAAAASSTAVSSASSSSPPSLPPPVSVRPAYSFLHADFRNLDWSDADVVFCNSTCFCEDLMIDLAKFALRLKRGALIITFTKRLPHVGSSEEPAAEAPSASSSSSPSPSPPPSSVRHFKLLSDECYEQSWGAATAYVHRKLTPPHWEHVEPALMDDVIELDKIISDLPTEKTARWRLEQEKLRREAESKAIES